MHNHPSRAPFPNIRLASHLARGKGKKKKRPRRMAMNNSGRGHDRQETNGISLLGRAVLAVPAKCSSAAHRGGAAIVWRTRAYHVGRTLLAPRRAPCHVFVIPYCVELASPVRRAPAQSRTNEDACPVHQGLRQFLKRAAVGRFPSPRQTVLCMTKKKKWG